MSTEIHLPGLLAREPAGAMASYGLYSVLPDVTIRWERSRNSHYPVIMNGVLGVDHLKAILLNPKTWERLNMPPQGGYLNKTQCTPEDYVSLRKSDPAFAQGLGCDQIEAFKDKQRQIPIIRRTPFYALYRGDSNFVLTVGKLIDLLANVDGDRLMKAMLDPVWEMFPGPNLSLFPSLTMASAFKSPSELEEPGGKSRTNPLLALLAVASWRLFPTYKLGRKITATGWVDHDPALTNGTAKRPCWVYPVFSRHTPRDTFLTWMLHPKLKTYRKNPVAWNAVGIDGVYTFGWEEHRMTDTITIYYMLRGEQL